MQKEHIEQLSSFMDGETTDSAFVESVSKDECLQACWRRYHIARDAMHGKLHDCSLTFDISQAVAESLANEACYESKLADQPITSDEVLPNKDRLFWVRAKEVISKISQVGLAACVTLGIIAGVQYHQGEGNQTSSSPVLNTVPVGVNIAPVGGLPSKNDQQLIEKRQYDKIRLLVQDYELQKRLNAH